MNTQTISTESALKPGQPAPDFTLISDEKKPVVLTQERGKNVVLLFFPAAFTSTCTEELCHMRDNLDAYNDLNAQVYGISVDMPYALAEYRKQQSLNFPLLSDFNKEASTAYGTIYNEWWGLKGVAKRSAFVVDREGIVRYAEVLEDAGRLPDFQKIRDTLSGLK